MSEIKLSWVLTTRNKLLFLREVLSRLTNALNSDEEIIVIDGGSTDGSAQYLRKLYESGQIHQFISEPDKGEAHGFNKGFLMARGELIKVITDDDAFYYPGIQACKGFMLAHPEVDILGTDGAGTNWTKSNPFVSKSHLYDEWYEEWKRSATPFNFSGLGIMIRRSSLPILGLFNTGFVWVDYEFSLRTTSGPANLAWYTGYIWVRITNPDSNTVAQSRTIRSDRKKLDQFYLGIDHKKVAVCSKYVDFAKAYTKRLRKLPRKIARSIAKRLGYISRQTNPGPEQDHFPKDWATIFEMCDQWLKEQNEKDKGQFMYKEAKS